MADQTKNTIVSELDDRLDSLFGEDVGDLDALEGSPLEGLKSLVMTIDWEISDSTLNALLEELNSLRSQYAGDKPVSILLKMMTSLAGYIRKHKGGSHPESIKLFHTVAKDLSKIVEEAGIDPRTRNAIVKKDIDRFQNLKSEIVGPAREEEVTQPPAEAAPVVEETTPVFEPVPEVPEEVSTFEPEPEAPSELESYPSPPPQPEEVPSAHEGAIEFEESIEPEMEVTEQEGLEREPSEDAALFMDEQELETSEEEGIPEYVMEETSESDLEQILKETSEAAGMPEMSAAQEIDDSTMEDLRELDEIFKEELSRVEEPLEEPGFEPIPSPEELGIEVEFSTEDRMEDAEPVLMTDQEELTEVFEVSEEPVEEMESLFAEQDSVGIMEPVTETMETPSLEPASVELEVPSPDEAHSASLQSILEAVKSLGKELRSELDELRSDVHETKEKLNRFLDLRMEFPAPGAFESSSRESLDMDFESMEEGETKLFSGERAEEAVAGEAGEGLDFAETSLEDIFEESEAEAGGGAPEEETKTLQELFEEAVAPKTGEEAEPMDFEFEGDDTGPDIIEEEEVSLEEVELEEDAEPAPQLAPESDLVGVTLGGREYALPSEFVVKTGKIKSKTRNKILNSGFAGIDDLRGPFQSLKKDIFPAWEHLSQKELRQLVFAVVTADIAHSGDQSEGKGYVLLMKGDRCGLLFTDEAPVRVGAEEAENVEPLDVERLLS